jgi:hypothetical protein
LRYATFRISLLFGDKGSSPWKVIRNGKQGNET